MCLLPSLLWTPVLSCSSCVSCHCGDSLPFLLRILLVREGSSYGRSQARVSFFDTEDEQTKVSGGSNIPKGP